MDALGLDELKMRHGGLWGSHTVFPVADWQHEVASGDTRRGYWEWVASRIEQAKEG
jgi:hypothetical protein